MKNKKEYIIDFVLYSLFSFGILALSYNSYQYYKKTQPIPLVIVDPIQLTPHVGSSFTPYVKDFLRFAYNNKKPLPLDFKKRLDSLTVKYGDPNKIKQGLVGFCNAETMTVIVDHGFWKHSSSSIKQQLIDHELSHCLLGRIHRYIERQGLNNLIESDSIMNPNLLSDSFYLENKNKLRNEIFQSHKYDKLWEINEIANKNWEKLHHNFSNVDDYMVFIHSVINDDICDDHHQSKLKEFVVMKDKKIGGM